ncbi:MAG: VWA domain-containing protein [Streptosporangiales bacterium]
MAEGAAALGVPFIRLLADFTADLRAAGLTAGTGDLLAYSQAMSTLDPADLLDLYWAGRATLVNRRDSIATYDTVFRRFFLGAPGPLGEILTLAARLGPEAQSVLEVPATEPPAGTEDGTEEEATLGLMASDAEALRHKAFTACTPGELAAVRRIMRRIRLAPPRRRTRRTAAAPAGRSPDLRRMVRESMRTGGEPAGLYWRQRKIRPRPLILILDVSGSMADYSRNLLQFAYSAKQATARVEVFCFGTRLTRVTRALDRRRPDDALQRAAQAVFDWEGGTRIGASLDAFVRDWGRRGLARGGIVVICSDGLDRGDPEVLAAAMERLARLSHRIVWMNPHKGANRDFQPSTLGMLVAAPHIDVLLSGHDLSSLEELATLLPTL